MNHPHIRKMLRSEIPYCVQLIRTSFMTVADEFGFTPENAPRFTAFSVSEDRLYWQADKEQRPMFVYCCAEKIVGYYSLYPGTDGRCELNQLCVLPSHRHRGIGKELLLHAFETVHTLGYSHLHIGIVEENSTLRRWYEQFGFKHIGTEKLAFFPFTCGYMEKML